MLQLIKTIFGDVQKLYLNFVHWNVSKLVYYIYWVLLALVGIIPVFLLFLLTIWFSDLSIAMIADFFAWTANGFELIGAVFASPIASILGLLLLVIMVLVWYSALSYGEYLIYGLNFDYIKSKTPKIFSKKRYLNWKFLWKYILVWAWLSLFVIIPYLVFALIFLVIVLYFGDPINLHAYILSQPNGALVISLFVGFIVTALVSLYIAYRLWFSFLILADTKKTNVKSLSYIKKSFSITKKWSKLWKFLVIFIITFIVALPVLVIWDTLEENSKQLVEYRNFVQAEGQLGKQQLEAELSAKNPQLLQTYQLLSLEYGEMSSDEVNSAISKARVWNIVYLIFYFLCVYWLFHMVFSSFYIRELKKK